MRFPISLKDPGTNETVQILDHRMVFQLAAAINDWNGNDSSLAVNFIPWIQASANQPFATSKRRPDGTVPGRAEVAANPTLADNVTATYSNATAVEEYTNAFDKWYDIDGRMKSIATNVFRAHKKAVEAGDLSFSEAQYIRFELGASLNITDQIDSIDDDGTSWGYDDVYFSASEWRTIDKGLSSLPRAFTPFVNNRTRYQTTVQELSYNESTKKVTVGWRPDNPFNPEPHTREYDYVTVAVPFTRVRLWHLPPYSNLLIRAITRMNYDPSCKVALHYKTRFWEHLPHPIYGGCGSVNYPYVGSICYPSYKINSTGPGVILASYVSGTPARSVSAMTATDHVALIQRAMIDVHGPIAADQFSGAYDRVCWANEANQAGAWCNPTTGQQQLYLPAYYRTEMHTVFVGEHTSFTHAWIFSALESGVRGAAQLLLDMGLVDEAKEITNTWMARWMSL
jgi:monoamine oxidase